MKPAKQAKQLKPEELIPGELYKCVDKIAYPCVYFNPNFGVTRLGDNEHALTEIGKVGMVIEVSKKASTGTTKTYLPYNYITNKTLTRRVEPVEVWNPPTRYKVQKIPTFAKHKDLYPKTLTLVHLLSEDKIIKVDLETFNANWSRLIK